MSVRPVLLLLLSTLPAHAWPAIVEEVVRVPVNVADRAGNQIDQEITVTVFRDDARASSPWIVLNHGRSGSAKARARFGRARYAANSRWFVERGFAVFLPTRIGYGVTGGPDLEHTGPCSQRDFAPGFEAAARQSVAVIEYAKAQPFVDASQGVLVGQSFGGATTLALMAKRIDGVLGAINFAGGSGGSPVRRPGDPCSSAELTRVFASYGTTIRRPTLWLYSTNDRYWGKTLPQRWYEGFRAAGGTGEFIVLPAFGDDGHGSFARNPGAWRPHVQHFLASLGLRVPISGR